MESSMRASPLRRTFVLAALLGPILFSLSCGGDSGSPSPTPTNVVVTPGADTLVSVGETKTFTAAVLDANGDPIDGRTVTWSSTAPTILSIDPTTGVATAVANGAAQVKATAGALQGSASVVVVQIVTSVTVTPGNVAFTAVGDTARFTAVAKDAGGTPVVGVQVLWSVSDNTVATIDTLGLAKSKGAGTALVSAQAQTHAGYAALGVDPTVTQFTILGAPSTGVAGDPSATALQVELRDARGNRVMNSSLAVSVAPAGAATGTPLHGTTTLLADQGRATFSGLWFEKAGADRLKVTVAALPADSSSAVAVAPGAPAVVRLDSIAPMQTAGVPLGLVARVKDRFGNVTTNFLGTAQAQLAETPNGDSFFGGFIINVDSGVAHFVSLNIHTAATPWRLTVFLPSTPTARDTTPPFEVQAGPPATFVVSHLGPAYAPFGHGGDSTSVHLADSFGNPAGGDTTLITVGTTGWPYAASAAFLPRLTSDTQFAVTGGQAWFNVGVSRPGPLQLVISAPGFAPDTTDAFMVHLPFAIGTSIGAADEASCLMATFCSGNNQDGLLGVDPLALPGDSIFVSSDSAFGGDIMKVDGGARHMCAVVQDLGFGSHVACWGDNSDGQLGNGTVGGHTFVYQAGPLVNVEDLSAGAAHTCISDQGLVECWGRNDQGQLGRGTTGASDGTPTPISNAAAHNFLRVAAGGRHTCALDDEQHVWCWGANDFGQLGDSGKSGANSPVPVEVDSATLYSDITTGEDFSCGTSFSGVVRCWGRNDKGQLGTAAADSTGSTPVDVLAIEAIIGGSLTAGAKFACVATHTGSDGYRDYCWGANDYGQLGRGTFSSFEATPLPTSAVGDYGILLTMSAGAEYICGTNMEPGPRYVCWGRNDHGQFGSGQTTGSSTPAVIEGFY
jgi:alpha-tubulin suppressor-like RCC1 family protein